MYLAAQGGRRFRFGPFEVDLETGELRKNRRKVRLQEKSFQVLIALLEEQGKLVTREALRQRLWPADTFVDFDNGLYTAISKLREALSDSAERHQYFETLARRGYRFVAPVEELGLPSTDERRELDIRRKRVEPDIVVVQIAGRIILGSECQQIEWLIADLIQESERKVVFDISRVTHVDSTGIGIVVMCSSKMKKAGGKLNLVASGGVVEDTLKMTMVDTLVPIYPTVPAAVAALIKA